MRSAILLQIQGQTCLPSSATSSTLPRYTIPFSIQALSGTFGEGQINLDLLGFTAGINATVPQAINSYSFSETLKLSDGSGTTLDIPFNVSINYSDVLTIAGGPTFSFADSGGSFWQIVLNPLTIGPNGGGPERSTLL